MILQSHHVLTHKAWRHVPSPADAKGVAPEDKDKEITTPEAIGGHPVEGIQANPLCHNLSQAKKKKESGEAQCGSPG